MCFLSSGSAFAVAGAAPVAAPLPAAGPLWSIGARHPIIIWMLVLRGVQIKGSRHKPQCWGRRKRCGPRVRDQDCRPKNGWGDRWRLPRAALWSASLLLAGAVGFALFAYQPEMAP